MNTREVAIMVFLNSKGEILLQNRGSYAKNGEDVAFFGGGLESGEMPSQALVREIKEELNIELDMFDYSYVGKFENINEDRSWRMLRYVFLYEGILELNGLQVLEGDGAEYHSIESARSLKFPSDVTNVLDCLAQIIEKNNK